MGNGKKKNEQKDTGEWAMGRKRMNRKTQVNGQWEEKEWTERQKWMGNGKKKSEEKDTGEWAMGRKRVNRKTQVNGQWEEKEWTERHRWMGNGKKKSEQKDTGEWAMGRKRVNRKVHTSQNWNDWNKEPLTVHVPDSSCCANNRTSFYLYSLQYSPPTPLSLPQCNILGGQNPNDWNKQVGTLNCSCAR